PDISIIPFSKDSQPIRGWMWRYLRPYRSRVAALCLLSLAEVSLRVVSPWPLKAVIDQGIGGATPAPWVARALRSFDRVAGLIHGAREQLLLKIVLAGLVL